MTSVRVLVGTQKGGFVLTSDGRRADWKVNGPHFGGWEIYHMVAARRPSPTAFTRRSRPAGSASSCSGLTTAVDRGGRPVISSVTGAAGTHQWYDGTPHPWEFARVWHLEPSPTDPDTLFAGAEDRGPVQVDRRCRQLDRALRAAHPSVPARTGSPAQVACAPTPS